MIKNVYRKLYQAANYRLRSAWGGRLASYVRPTFIALLLTKRCNARCVHCDIWKNQGDEDTLTLDEWKALLSELRRWLGPVHIHITGGEALLRPYAPEVAAHASSLGFFVEFLTNGYSNDQRRIERLAKARPARVTISLDGVGETHSTVRGREGFWEKTSQSIDTLRRVRQEKGSHFSIRLKTVVMDHNLDAVADVARYARSNGLEVLYQPIEQNYDTPDDPDWFEHAPTWPRDPEKAVRVVEDLISLQREGLPIVNTDAEFAAMTRYFRNPRSNAAEVQAHVSHERRAMCSSLGNLQIEPNGDVLTCFKMPPIGNARSEPIRMIWSNRPRWWEGGCCLEKNGSMQQ